MGARTTKDAMTVRRFPPPWDIEIVRLWNAALTQPNEKS